MKNRVPTDLSPEVRDLVMLMMTATKTTDEIKREDIRRKIESGGAFHDPA